MPRKTEIISDFPLGDVKGDIGKDNAVEVSFIRRYQNGFFKSKPMFMSADRFRKLLKDTNAKPDWQIWDTVTTSAGIEVKDETGKVKKQWFDCVEPEKMKRGGTTL